MSDDILDDIDLDGEGGAVKRKKKGLSGKKLVLLIILPLLLIGGGGVGAYLSGLLDGVLGISHPEGEGGEGEAAGEAAEEAPKQVVFYDLPEMLVNLNAGGKKASYLKLKVALELGNPETIPEVERLLPRIIDNFQVYLRGLRSDDLTGSAGLYRLKEELLTRVSQAVKPVRINDVLFKEMLVQ